MARVPTANPKRLTATANRLILAPDERLLPAVGFGQLTGNPMGARACGHTKPQKLAAGMLQDQKSIQRPK
jgi:hypothetical protein